MIIDEEKLEKEIKGDNILFSKLFSKYQKNLRINPDYIKYQAFKDLKIIFDLYSKIYHFKGYNYNDIQLGEFKKLTKGFNCHQRRELYEHLAKRLLRQGNDEKSKEILQHVNYLEIICAYDNVKKGKKIGMNIFKLVHRASAYNLLTLTCILLGYVLFAMLIYSGAPHSSMQVLVIEKVNFSSTPIWNAFLNTLSHIFDLDKKMTVQPINGLGVLLLVLGKSFFIVVILNYIVKEIFNKIKFS